MDRPSVLILGSGFTGSRVATRLAALGMPVFCTSRSGHAPEGCHGISLDVTRPATLAALSRLVPPGALVLQSIPLVDFGGALHDPTPLLIESLRPIAPARVVCLSTTGVYGAASHVDETTVPSPRTPRETLRFEGERALAAGPWSCLVLRPAAIYGPFRGVHARMRAGEFALPRSAGAISRIYVDDLVEIVVAALRSTITGAFPVADERPCTSLEVATFCAALFCIPMPPTVAAEALSETLRADRRVDGRAICAALRVKLRYPTFEEGIRAAVAEESRQFP